MHDVTVQAPEQTQVGVITFSYDAKREFDMNTYSTKDEVLQAVESIHYKVRDCAMFMGTAAAYQIATKPIRMVRIGKIFLILPAPAVGNGPGAAIS